MSELPELDIYDEGAGGFSVAPKGVALLTREQAGELKHRSDCHDELVAAPEAAYKEGYEAGYADGIEADESCVPETTIFKNDFAKAWRKSDTKAQKRP